MKKVAIVGKCLKDGSVSDGQLVKTRILLDEFERLYGADQIVRINTLGWKKNPGKLVLQCIKAVWTCKNVFIMTDENGTKVVPPLLLLANLLGRSKLHYYVIGGWLSHYLDRSALGRWILKKLDAIYVEVPAMYKELEDRGFKNGVLVNKFRRLNPVEKESLILHHDAPYKLCLFSRVMKEKGVEEAIAAVQQANEECGYIKYELDIFGRINDEYREDFDRIMKSAPPFVRYKGIVDFQKSKDTLQLYFAMLFPTFYKSEGYPNTIVDAFAAGLPVIATRWNYNADIIHDGEDGILVDVKDIGQMVDAMNRMADDPALYAQMRYHALDRCAEYMPENAIKIVQKNMK